MSHSPRQVLSRFESYGLWGGLGLGLLVGVLASGPNFHDRTIGTSLLVIAVGAIVGAVIGFRHGLRGWRPGAWRRWRRRRGWSWR
jgi:hypothetical protein